jgi:hypothetical protein
MNKKSVIYLIREPILPDQVFLMVNYVATASV